MYSKAKNLLIEFNETNSNSVFSSKKYNKFEKYINNCISGEGMIGENSYLILWEKEELEELNDMYEVNEFLNNCILIGSNGGDNAYGLDIEGNFFEVPFIGMKSDEIKILGNSFEEFIEKIYIGSN